jgi:non-specific serine/threonine protein kinase
MRWLDLLERELDNLRAALRWSLEQAEGVGDEEAGIERETGLRLAGALVRFWVLRGYYSEGQNWLEHALASSEESGGAMTPLRAKVLNGAGWLASIQGQAVRAETLYEESLALCRKAGETHGMALSLHWLGWLALRKGNDSSARSLLEESCVLFRKVGDKGNLAYSLHFLAGVAVAQDKYVEASSLLEEGLVLFKEMNNKEGLAWGLRFLARFLFAQGDETRAYRSSRRALHCVKK